MKKEDIKKPNPDALDEVVESFENIRMQICCGDTWYILNLETNEMTLDDRYPIEEVQKDPIKELNDRTERDAKLLELFKKWQKEDEEENKA